MLLMCQESVSPYILKQINTKYDERGKHTVTSERFDLSISVPRLDSRGCWVLQQISRVEIPLDVENSIEVDGRMSLFFI